MQKLPKNLNKHFKVVFQPKNPELFSGRRRFCVGIYSLHKYVGQKNAINCVAHAFRSLDQVPFIKLRKWGLVQFYSK